MTAPTTNCDRCNGPLPDWGTFCPTCAAPIPERAASPSTAIPVADTADFRTRLQRALGPALELRGLLGRGGFAEVYVAWDTRLKRELAVKTIREDLGATDQLRERFQREAEAVAKLRHPNIVPIYTVGEERGVAFFTMPRIVGETLAAVLERDERMDARAACRIIAEAAGALEASHRDGVVHRDVKPENIMLEGSEQRALMMDFGIAKTGTTQERNLTGTGMFVGTPDYMSPEQAAGERELDHRSDQYSLALVAFRMLTGMRAFESDSAGSFLYKQATTVPPLVSDLNPDAPGSVALAIRRALSNDPAGRYPSIGEFGIAIATGMGTISGPGSGAIPRRERDIAARVRVMRESLPSWRHPMVLAGAVGLTLALALMPASLERPGIAMGALRDDAGFASKTWLTAHGVSRPARTSADLTGLDSTYAFLQRAVGRTRADSYASLVWFWRNQFRDSAGTAWRVDVGPGAHVVGFNHTVPDSLPRTTIDSAAALALATRELEFVNLPLDSLVRDRDSLVTRLSRTDRFINWRWKSGMVVLAARDTAWHRVRVAVQGDRVERLRQWLDMPPHFVRDNGDPTWLTTIHQVSQLSAFVLVIALIAFTVTRQRIDTLQWHTAGRLAAAAVLLSVPMMWYSSLDDINRNTGQTLNVVIGSIVVNLTAVAACVAAGLCAFVATESLAAEVRPGVFDGVRDLARGRLMIPEVTLAAVWGGLGGVAALGTLISVRAIAVNFMGVSILAGTPSLFDYDFSPVVVGLIMSLALPAVISLLFALLLAVKRVPVPAAIMLVSILGSGLIGTDATHHWSSMAGRALVVAILAFTLWHCGFLAGLVAMVVALIAPELFAVATAPEYGGHAFALALSFAMVFAPVVAGLVAYRRAALVAARPATG